MSIGLRGVKQSTVDEIPGSGNVVYAFDRTSGDLRLRKQIEPMRARLLRQNVLDSIREIGSHLDASRVTLEALVARPFLTTDRFAEAAPDILIRKTERNRLVRGLKDLVYR